MSYDNTIEGWFSDEDAVVYYNLVASLPLGGMIAEVGVHCGRSLSAIAKLCELRGIVVHAVDNWLDESIYQQFKANSQRARWVNIIVDRTPSLEAAKLALPASYSLAFIDALHDYDNVKADIAAWTPLVRAGGILAGHDYHPTHAGVVQAVDEAFPNVVKPSAGSSVWHVRL